MQPQKRFFSGRRRGRHFVLARVRSYAFRLP